MLDYFAEPDVMYIKVIGFGKRLWKVQNKEAFDTLRELEYGDTLAIIGLGWLTVSYLSAEYDRKNNVIKQTVVCEPQSIEY